MVKPSFTNQAQLVEDLWNEIKSTGLYVRKGNEFYDYVLYLLNKYDENNFFSTNDNADNERLLKINDSQLKDAKKNISVKFMDDSEYNAIFLDFVKRLSKGKLPNLADDGESYTMVVEDIVTRDAIETRLKRVANTTLKYNQNTELVSISHESLMKLLAAEVESANSADNSDIKKLLEDTTNSLKGKKTMQGAKQCIDKAIEALCKAAPVPLPDSLKELGIDALKVVAVAAWNKIVDKRKKEIK